MKLYNIKVDIFKTPVQSLCWMEFTIFSRQMIFIAIVFLLQWYWKFIDRLNCYTNLWYNFKKCALKQVKQVYHSVRITENMKNVMCWMVSCTNPR